jgi:hypothetical protein
MLGSTARVWTSSILAFVLLTNLAVAIFVVQERTVYFWDNTGYWRRAQLATHAAERVLGLDRPGRLGHAADEDPQRDLTPKEKAAAAHKQKALASPTRAFRKIMQSIWYDDYNVFTVLPLLPWTIICGVDRLSYVLAILNVYAVLAVILLCIFCFKICRDRPTQNQPWQIWIPLAITLSFPLFWAPVVRGMVDVGVLVFNIAALLIYFSQRQTDLGWRALIAIGMLLPLSVIFRRWNAYWVVSFLIVIGLDGVVAFIAAGERTLASLLRHLRASLVIASLALAILGALAGPFLIKAATTNYADIYGAYRFHRTFIGRLWEPCHTIGYLSTLIFALAAVVLIRVQETRRLALMLTGQVAIVIVLFLRTQSFSIQHYYLLQASWLIMSSMLAFYLVERLRGRQSKVVLVAGIAVTAVACDSAVFVPSVAPWHAWLQPLLPQDTYYPLVRNDVAELNQLYAKLDDLLRIAGPQATFYVASATYELNDTHFVWTSISPPFKFHSSHRLLSLQYVDKRDGFPWRLLQADYVVVGTPVGGNGDSCQILMEPARLISERIGLGQAYQALPDVYHLDHGVTARIYRKVREPTPAELQSFSDYLRRWYPDRPYIFDPRYHLDHDSVARAPVDPRDSRRSVAEAEAPGARTRP